MNFGSMILWKSIILFMSYVDQVFQNLTYNDLFIRIINAYT